MFMSILALACILAVTFKVDYKTLILDGSKLQSVSYCLMFAIGFISIAVYLLIPELPSPLTLIQGEFKPIREWVSP